MAPKHPRVSFISGFYNRTHLIERSIENILKQTYENWELILVNNGSMDNTWEILTGNKRGHTYWATKK